jgi:hypothetical protein
MLFTAATHDAGVAAIMEAFGSRRIGPARMMLTATPMAAWARLRRRVSLLVGRGGAGADAATLGASSAGALASPEAERSGAAHA